MAQRVRLLKFAPELQDSLSHDKISVSNAEVLNRLAAHPERLKGALEKTMTENLTTLQATEMVQAILADIELNEDVATYMNSEEYLIHVHSVALDVRLSDMKSRICPLCLVPASIVESEDCDYTCTKCRWNPNTYEQPFNGIVRRVRARILRRQGKFIPSWANSGPGA